MLPEVEDMLIASLGLRFGRSVRHYLGYLGGGQNHRTQLLKDTWPNYSLDQLLPAPTLRLF